MDSMIKQLLGANAQLAEKRLHLEPHLLNGIKIRAVGRQVAVRLHVCRELSSSEFIETIDLLFIAASYSTQLLTNKNKKHTLKLQLIADTRTRDIICTSTATGRTHAFNGSRTGLV